MGEGGGVLVRESNFESKTANTHEGGGGGNVKNVMKKFGKFLERAKAVPGCVVMNGKKCSKPMAECLQRKSCDIIIIICIFQIKQIQCTCPHYGGW